MSNVRVICVTGGPCAGKSTIIRDLQVRLREAGYNVAVAPEAATILLENGCGFRPACPYSDSMRDFQISICRLQEALEDGLVSNLNMVLGKGVLLADRGMLDNAAYVTTATWQEVQESMDTHWYSMRDRYHGVLHLVSAAEGAEAHYQNSATRCETTEEARVLEARTRAAWAKHPNVAVVDNSTGFADKIVRARQAVFDLLTQADVQENKKRCGNCGFCGFCDPEPGKRKCLAINCDREPVGNGYSWCATCVPDEDGS